MSREKGRAMCLAHRYARHVTADGRIVYSCLRCHHEVDWTEAREELERMRGDQCEHGRGESGPAIRPQSGGTLY